MITVNGKEIGQAAILAEMQYHPAATREAAMKEAAKALVVRELLRQRARALGITWDETNPVSEEKAVDDLLAREVKLPEADPKTCRRWYEANREKFRTKPLFEASHILYLAPRDDEAARKTARERATRALEVLALAPDRFAEIARAESRCSSASDGGRLGQIALGETCPELDTFFMALEEGQICPVPVETGYGVHVILLHRRIEGRLLSFDEAEPRVRGLLLEHAWRMAVRHYLSQLTRSAQVGGIDLPAPASPLVQ